MNKKITFGITALALGLGITFLASCGNSKTYKITFDSRGGTPIPTMEVKWGETPTLPDSPTLTGYTFDNWYKEAELKNVYTPAPVEFDFTLYAGYNINQYTVTFVTNVEGKTIDPITADYNSTITIPEISKDYYQFGGWFLESSYTTRFNGVVPAKNITVYAKWNPNSVKISFDRNGDESEIIGTMDSITLSETSQSKKLPKNVFKRTGYDFKGWATTSEGEVKYHDEEVLEHIEINGNLTLFAKWEIKTPEVRFFTSKDSALPFYSTNVVYGEVIQFPEEKPTLEGYKFNGWGKMVLASEKVFDGSKQYFKKTGSGYAVSNYTIGEDIPANTYYTPVELQDEYLAGETDNDFYAIFERLQFSVRFIRYISEDDFAVIEEKTNFYGETVTAPSLPSYSGYTARGWYYGKDAATAKAIDNDGTVVVIANTLDIYALYNINTYKLKIYIDSTTPTVREVTYKNSVNDALKNLNPTKEHYHFVGWYLDEDFTQELQDNTLMPASDFNVYAKFVINQYTITFDAQGGSACDPITQDYNSTVILPTTEQEGYTARGWNSQADGKGTWYTQATMLMPGDNITLYQIWSINSYSLEFVLNGGTGDVFHDEVEYKTKLSDVVDQDDPTRVGYEFTGWNSKQDGTGETLNMDTAVMGASDTKYYAQWNALDVDVTIVYKGAKLGDETVFNEDMKDEHGEVVTKVVKAKTDSTFTVSSESQYALAFNGFTYKEADTVTVKGDGTSVVEVRYTRDVYSITFVSKDPLITIPEATIAREFGAKVGVAKPLDTYVDEYYIVKGGDEVKIDNISELVVDGTFEEILVDYRKVSGVIYQGNGGKFGNDTVVNESHTEGEIFDLHEAPSRTGYTFTGWYDAQESGKLIGQPGDPYTMPDNTVTMYAHWQAIQVQVTFNPNGGSDPQVSGKYDYDSVVTLPATTREHYTFDGWYIGEEKLNNSFTVKSLTDITVDAHWVSNQITITYNKNNDNATGTMSDQKVLFTDDTKVFLDNGFTLKGNTFTGWNTKADGTGVSYTAGSAIPDNLFTSTNETLTLYAQWGVNQYTMYFYVEEADDPDLFDSVVYDYGDPVFELGTKPTKTGYVFDGWFEEGEDTPYSFKTMPDSDVKLYGHWHKETHKVIFNVLEGNPIDVSYNMSFEYGDSLETLVLPEATRDHYTFDGWYTQNGSSTHEWGEEVDATWLAANTMGTSDINLYAHFTLNKHTVTYWNTNGSAKLKDSQEVNYGESVDLTAPDNVPDGQIFEGWFTKDGDGNFAKFDSSMTMLDSDLNLYAQFAVYEIVYKNGGSTIYSTTSDKDDGTLTNYMRQLLNEIKGYTAIYDVCTDAAGGDVTGFMGFGAYLQLCTMTREQIAYYISGEAAKAGITLPVDYLLATYQTKEDIIVFAANYVGLSSFATREDLARYLANKAQAQELPITYDYLMATYQTKEEMLVFGVGLTYEYNLTKNRYLVSTLLNCLPIEQYPSLYAQYAEILNDKELDDMRKANDVASITSANKLYAGAEYESYKENAYYPTSGNDGEYFDGYAEYQDNVNKVITKDATYVTKAQDVRQISFVSKTNRTATFTWDEVADAYGYDVTLHVTGHDPITVEVYTNEYTVEGLQPDDKVTITVRTILKDGKGNAKRTTTALEATDLETAAPITVPATSLLSDPVSINYLHLVEQEIDPGDVTTGAYYYKVVDSQTGKTSYHFFTNGSYGFGTSRVLTIDESQNNCGASVEVDKDGNNILKTSGRTGTFIFYINGDTQNPIVAEVKPILENIVKGTVIQTYENVEIGNDAKAYKDVDFLGEEKETFKVGIADSSKGQRGVKFDILSLSDVGKEINIDRAYKFTKIEGETRTVIDADDLYTYDKDSDTFFFKKNTYGIYEMEVTVREDDLSNSYLNVTVPNALKESYKSLKQVFTFEITDGANVYTSEELRLLMQDPTVTGINVLANINTELDPGSICYVPYAETLNNDVKSRIIGNGDEQLQYGELDIKSETAIMTTSDGYGPKIWVQDDANPLFKDVNKKGYRYQTAADVGVTKYAIQHADWEQNFDQGSFKIINYYPDPWTVQILNTVGLRVGSVYKRTTYSGAEDLVINGNYLTVDGSNLPFIKGTSSNSAGGVKPLYEVQNIAVGMFINQSNSDVDVNCLNVISNTTNLSKSDISGSSLPISELMKMTSGGYNGFISRAADGGSLDLYSVSLTNSLIGIYCDYAMNCEYTIVNNSWANGVYGYSNHDYAFRITHSAIVSSGGAAIHLEDQIYTIGEYPSFNPEKDPPITYEKTNMTAVIDYATCYIENFVSGDEQWFKAYSMEVLALGLKTQIDSAVFAMSGGTKTIVKTIENPVTHLTSQCINWVYFNKNQEINNGDHANLEASDIGCELFLGENYYWYMLDESSGFNVYLQLDPNTRLPARDPVTGNVRALFVNNKIGKELAPGVWDAGIYPTKCGAMLEGEFDVVALGYIPLTAEYQMAGLPVQEQTFLYFRMIQSGFGYISGMVEMFDIE